jgi:hypothetical protein
MADEQVQPTDSGAVEEREPKGEGLTEEQLTSILEKRLEENNRKWQSRFDQVLKEKKDVETKSKTAEERIADIERRYEEERLGRTRERVLHETALDATVIDAAREFLSNSEEGIKAGASRLKEYIQAQIEAGVKAGVDQEVNRRFKDAPKPQGGAPGTEMSKEEFIALTDEQYQAMGPQKVAEMTRKFTGR